MNNTANWINHFTQNLTQQRINWNITPAITSAETDAILPSLQAWQLGETSDGSQLLCAATKYALATGEPAYIDAIALFIKEEQKHGNNLGRYLDMIGEPRIQRNWGDVLFRKIRHLNASMEWWTLAVITVENAAQVFYQSLKDATKCPLLKQICTDILIDEAYHLNFQTERMRIIYNNKPSAYKWMRSMFYKLFYNAVIITVWLAHKKVFKAGGNSFKHYMVTMKIKYKKTLERAMSSETPVPANAAIKRIINPTAYLQSVTN